ncbi:MAG TPA: family 78 glycoside hydrolase catalytic domain [Armatimonadota bacterium]|nr:family 78 glycoside hydrolase catalytic domain [Armatimonadota bacterium]
MPANSAETINLIMRRFTIALALHLALLAVLVGSPSDAAPRSPRRKMTDLHPIHLRCEYLTDPTAIDETAPRLSWKLESAARGQRQSAYRLLVATTRERLAREEGDLWDTGKTSGDETSVVYLGKPLASRVQCFWKIRSWDREAKPSAWSETASWGMGLLRPGDWQGQWISYRDTAPLHKSRESLYLPPPRLYRDEFPIRKPVRRAVVYASALGCYDLHLNGKRVSDAWFTPGWSDYRRRVYYNAFDVTGQLQQGANALGAMVAEGWYSGYVGYGLLVGYGPDRVGRYFYGKTPALRAQLEIEYADGTRETVATGPEWKVTDRHPIREADILMGESYDARMEVPGWDRPGYDATGWESAIPAAANGSTRATFYDSAGQRDVELGFVEPKRLQAYPGVPIRATEELRPVRITEPGAGTYIFDMGQNFSGVVRLKVKGPAGTRVRIRHGEMLHADGRLMTENLRRARATDFYVLRGDPAGETWTPRFTYHGFQYVELTGFPGKPETDAVTGVVVHSDTPLTSRFECSDPVVNRLFRNVVWTQRANFFDIPTDCPQRDERLGWTGDAQVYVRAATYHADVAAFFTKWLDDLEEAQLPSGAYPDYAPYPMFHGGPEGYGTAWTDAGIICPYTIYKVYGDTRVIERHWESMVRFMEFRKRRSPDFRGVSHGNTWGDWLSLGEETPIQYVDAAYFAYSARLMAEMAAATGKDGAAAEYRKLFEAVATAWRKEYLNADGSLKLEMQTPYALALWVGLFPEEHRAKAGDRLEERVRKNGNRMATGFLGTRPLLPVLSATGHHDLAARLLQSRQFPSWGYEVVNGATSIWERWNSYTKEGGIHEPSMNSFSHYSFGAVSEWMFQSLAGIETDGPGFRKLLLRPGPPTPAAGMEPPPIDWVKAEYDSPTGPIAVRWKRDGRRFELETTLPANTTATLYLPATGFAAITEGGKPLGKSEGARFERMEGDRAVLALGSGSYRFVSEVE